MSLPLPVPDFRFRRLRRTANLRGMVRETRLAATDLILPIFVEEGISSAVPIASMPGVVRHTEAGLGDAVAHAWEAGIRAVILFGVSKHKDAAGSDTWNPEGLLARMVRSAKAAAPGMVVISDNCFCEYTDHGHCGVVHGDEVLNLAEHAANGLGVLANDAVVQLGEPETLHGTLLRLGTIDGAPHQGDLELERHDFSPP